MVAHLVPGHVSTTTKYNYAKFTTKYNYAKFTTEYNYAKSFELTWR